MITYENYYKRTTEENINVTNYLEQKYDNTKESIVKLISYKNFSNTDNKNKKFFQYDCEKSENVQPIPLGVTSESFHNFPKIQIQEKSILCSSQYNEINGDRNQLQSFPFVTYFQRQSNLKYLENISKSKYVLSPHGSLPDCYRHYESMYLSAIPITIRHPKIHFLEDLPVLLLDSWDELTEDLLITSYDTIINKSREKLDINYWINLMREPWTE